VIIIILLFRVVLIETFVEGEATLAVGVIYDLEFVVVVIIFVLVAAAAQLDHG